MATCPTCGEAVHFRHYEGKIRPFGCRCGSSQGNGATASEREQRLIEERRLRGTSNAEVTTVPWSTTYRTPCFWCGEFVFYHTNGYGDCVLLDELGPPWPIHHCWIEEREDRIRAIGFEERRFSRQEMARNRYQDGSVDEEAVPQDAWYKIETLPDGVLNLDQLYAAELIEPGESDEECSFIVKAHLSSGPGIPLGTHTLELGGEPLKTVETVQGTILWLPNRFAASLNKGACLVAEVLRLRLKMGTILLCHRVKAKPGRPTVIPPEVLKEFLEEYGSKDDEPLS